MRFVHSDYIVHTRRRKRTVNIKTKLPFQTFGSGLALWLAALPMGLSSFAFWAHALYFLSWLLMLPSVYQVAKTAQHRWATKAVASFILVTTFALLSDHYTVKVARAKVAVIGADLRVARPGYPYEATLQVKNIGNASADRVGDAYAIGAGYPDNGNAMDKTAFEQYVFDQSRPQEAQPGSPTLAYGANSAVNALVVKGQHRVASEEEIRAIRAGEASIYVTGRIAYQDAEGVQYTDFCLLWNARISSGNELTFCRTHNGSAGGLAE